MIRTFKYPLLANRAQRAALDEYVYRCRQLYNAALEQRIDAYRKQKRTLTRYDQQLELTTLRRQDPDFGAIPTTVLRSALRRVELAYQAFFRRLKTGGKPGFPRYRGRDRYDSFDLQVRPKIDGDKILIPKIGPVRLKLYRPLKGDPLDATIRRDTRGKWWACIKCDLGAAPVKMPPKEHAGVDVGLLHFATLSNGETVENPRYFRKGEAILAERQRKLATKKRGSKSRQRQKMLVARAHERVRNQRLNFVRHVVVALLARFDCISYENLNIAGLVHGNLAKSIHDAAWARFIHALTCKAEEAGKWAVGVDPRGTSQTCNRCRVKSETKLALSDRTFVCSCGPPIDRDHNAAINIDALGWSALEAA